MKPEPSEVACRGVASGSPVLALIAVEEILEELLERRARRELRHVRAGALGLVGLDGLGRRDVDHRRQQLCRQIGEAVGRRAGPGEPGERPGASRQRAQQGAAASAANEGSAAQATTSPGGRTSAGDAGRHHDRERHSGRRPGERDAHVRTRVHCKALIGPCGPQCLISADVASRPVAGPRRGGPDGLRPARSSRNWKNVAIRRQHEGRVWPLQARRDRPRASGRRRRSPCPGRRRRRRSGCSRRRPRRAGSAHCCCASARITMRSRSASARICCACRAPSPRYCAASRWRSDFMRA